jgi:hypothetical protein
MMALRASRLVWLAMVSMSAATRDGVGEAAYEIVGLACLPGGALRQARRRTDLHGHLLERGGHLRRGSRDGRGYALRPLGHLDHGAGRGLHARRGLGHGVDHAGDALGHGDVPGDDRPGEHRPEIGAVVVADGRDRQVQDLGADADLGRARQARGIAQEFAHMGKDVDRGADDPLRLDRDDVLHQREQIDRFGIGVGDQEGVGIAQHDRHGSAVQKRTGRVDILRQMVWQSRGCAGHQCAPKLRIGSGAY